MTSSGKLHVFGASLDYTPLAALLLSAALARNQAWRPIRKWLVITAGISLIATVAFIVSIPRDFKFGPGVPAGLIGRFLVISYLGWLLAVGFRILEMRKQAKRQNSSI